MSLMGIGGGRRRHHRILVIGSTGAGKSSLINALVGYEAMSTSSDAVGCTGLYSTVTTERKAAVKSSDLNNNNNHIINNGDDNDDGEKRDNNPPEDEDNNSNNGTNNDTNDGDEVIVVNEYEFIDTVGVNEPEEGTVSRSEALKLFFKFLKDNKEGFNLIIFCTREGRVTEESKKTYEIMVKKLYSGSGNKEVPPVLIFVGGMFMDYEHPQDWCEANRATFLRQGFVEAEPALNALHAIALPKSKNPTLETVFATTRAESAKRAWTIIEKIVRPAPIELFHGVEGLMALAHQLWNSIAKNFGWPLIIPDVLREIAKACGFTSRDLAELDDSFLFVE